MLTELKKNNPSLIPYALLQTFFKLAGYRLGRASVNAPLWFKQMCSSQKFYWKSNK
jgi:rhamnosyltransferase